MVWFALTIWSIQLCRQSVNNNSELSVSSSEAELCLCKVSVESLNAAANSGENSNQILDKLQADKWAKDWAAVACVWWGSAWPLLVGREKASFFAPIHPMALGFKGSLNWLIIPCRNGKGGYALSFCCMSVCVRGDMRPFAGFRVWHGPTGQRAGRAALLLYVSELWNRAQLFWPSVCLIKLCTINGSASWDWNHNPQGTFQQIWFEFRVAVKYETRWVSCGFRFCWKPVNQL